MPSLFELIGEALQAYWFSPLSLSVLAVCGASIGTLLYVFVTNAQNAKLRVSLLTGLYALSIFFWAFIAASLVLCVSQSRMISYARFGLPVASLGIKAGRSQFLAMNFKIEVWSITSWSTKPGFEKGETMIIGTRKP